jgi:hypothetical protein
MKTEVNKNVRRVRESIVAKREYQVIERNLQRNTIKVIDVETGDSFHTHVPILGAASYFSIGTIIVIPQLYKKSAASNLGNRRDAKPVAEPAQLVTNYSMERSRALTAIYKQMARLSKQWNEEFRANGSENKDILEKLKYEINKLKASYETLKHSP